MKIKHIYLFLFAALAVNISGSCTKELDLDEDTRLLIDTKEKLARLDELYDLAFEDAIKADGDFLHFVQNELLTEDQNFLANQDVLWRKTMTDMAIRMNKNFELAKDTLSNAAIFDLYNVKFETDIVNQTLFSEVPKQLQSGERFQKFRDRMPEILQWFDDKIKAFADSHKTPDQQLLGKTWFLSTFTYQLQPVKIYWIDFDFAFKQDGTLDITKFFFFPWVAAQGSITGLLGDQKEENFNPADLKSPAQYMTYGNKLFFYFHIKSTYDPLGAVDIQKLEREWIYEYNYSIEDGKLVLSNPRMSLLRFPQRFSRTPGDDAYKDYLEGLKQYTLTVK